METDALVYAAPITYLWLILLLTDLVCIGWAIYRRRWNDLPVLVILFFMFFISFSSRAQIADLQFIKQY